MKTLPVTQLFVQANTHRSVSSRDAERAMIEAAMARYCGPIEQLPPYQAKPAPARRAWIDPETKLIRSHQCSASRELDQRAAAIIRRHGQAGMKAVRQQLKEAGIGMPPRRVELIAVRHGIAIAEDYECVK